MAGGGLGKVLGSFDLGPNSGGFGVSFSFGLGYMGFTLGVLLAAELVKTAGYLTVAGEKRGDLHSKTIEPIPKRRHTCLLHRFTKVA